MRVIGVAAWAPRGPPGLVLYVESHSSDEAMNTNYSVVDVTEEALRNVKPCSVQHSSYK